MKTWHLVIDVARCHDCNNCFLACKDEYVGNDWPGYAAPQPWEGHRWMDILRTERGQFPQVKVAYLPLLCQHCDEAPCQKASPPGTITKRPDGLVLIDPEKAKGKKEIVDTCPYGVIYWNEELKVPQKCTGCAHLMDQGWKDTRCTQVCPTEALKLVLCEEEEMEKRAAADGLQAYRPELGSRPRVYFKNLPLWTKAFLAGSVAWKDSGACAEGVTVTASENGTAAASGKTTVFGDFCLEGLEPGKTYTLTIQAPGHQTLTSTHTVGPDSLTLPVVFLEKG
jgi:Fe-S-cluster-containing dehydrogenase component